MSDRPIIVVLRGVLRDPSGRFLLLQRSSKSKSWPSFWEFPGGKVDKGETDEMALSREFWEETGLVVQPGEMCADFSWERAEDSIHYRIFFVEKLFGDVVISSEHEGFGWFSCVEMKGLSVSPPLIKVIENLA